MLKMPSDPVTDLHRRQVYNKIDLDGSGSITGDEIMVLAGQVRRVRGAHSLHILVESILEDALCFLNVCSAKCLNWSILIRAHVTRQYPWHGVARADGINLSLRGHSPVWCACRWASGWRRRRCGQRWRSWTRTGRERSRLRARAHCRFVPPSIHFVPDFLTYSAPLFLKQQCDRTLGRLRRVRGVVRRPHGPSRRRRQQDTMRTVMCQI